jgi:uncharacterized protein YjbI with pentapeptide repeats
LSSASLDGANLSGARLNDARLNGANLINVQFGCFDISEISKCTNLENINWDENTQWQGIKGWDKVKNIPPALKQQLGLQ